MLTKDLLCVSRAGGGYQPVFAGRADRPLAARVLGTYQGHVGQPRNTLEDALTDLEREEPSSFKLVRGFARLIDREATFETRAPVDPERARSATFEAAESVSVVTEAERQTALERAADSLHSSPAALERSLYADLEQHQILTDLDVYLEPDTLVARYNRSLAQTALFDATEIRVRSSDPRRLISAIKRLGLMYELRKTDEGREVVVTGPTTLVAGTRRYGTRFARLLRSVARADEWHFEATIDDRGSERTMRLSDADPIHWPDASAIGDDFDNRATTPGDTAPGAEDPYDSDVERAFAGRFSALDLPWTLVREPDPLATGTRVMIPDFAFDYAYGDFRVYFEIMGFWTPEYVEKKLTQLEDVEDVELVVAVDESLGVGEAVSDLDHRVVPYSNRVPVKAVAAVLREYETDLVAESAASLPDELVPDEDAISLDELAARYGVDEDAIERQSFPDHVRVGRTLVRPAVLDALADRLEAGMDVEGAEARFEEYGITETSSFLSRLGYGVEWDGLAGGVLVER